MPCAVSQGSAEMISPEILPGSSLATVATSLATTGKTSAMNSAIDPSSVTSTMAMPAGRGIFQASKRSITGSST